jgi:hypothetical protein
VQTDESHARAPAYERNEYIDYCARLAWNPVPCHGRRPGYCERLAGMEESSHIALDVRQRSAADHIYAG